MRRVLSYLVLVGVALALSVHVGATGLGLGELLVRIDSHDEFARHILWEVRLPRALVGVLVGAALAGAGCVLQALFRNPLADPAVLGVSASAALGAQAVLFLGWSSPGWVPSAACAGAALATLALMALLSGRQHGSLESLILGGMALGHLALAASALLLSLALADFSVAQRLLHWMLGTLDGRSWLHVFWALGPVLLGSAWLLVRARALDGLLLGDVTSVSLGIDVRSLRRELLLVTALLSGISVAVGGMVSFVGLLVPHLMRRLVGGRHSNLLPACLVGGGVFVVAADMLARTLIAPEQLQLSVITAAVGAPWFVLVLWWRFREASS